MSHNRGRPNKMEHICNCGKEYRNAQTLASHKYDAKIGKTKCTTANIDLGVSFQGPLQQKFLGYKSMFDQRVSQPQLYEE